MTVIYPPNTTPPGLDWPTLVAAEPRLLALEAYTRAWVNARTENDPRWCPLDLWYGMGQYQGAGLKAQLLHWVGWNRPAYVPGPAWLKASPAYEVAYTRLFGLLPRCSGQACANRGHL